MNLYESIEESIRDHEESLHVTNEVTESDVRHAIRWVMRDYPDIFWFVHQYHFDKDDGIVSFRYRCSSERCAVIQKSIDDVVEKDFQINYVRTLTQLEQVVYVYKWMLTYCNYNTNSAYNQNIDSVFVRRNSVCTGYAKAAQYLFKLLGIESRLVFGRLNNDNEDGRHCWNIVNIEGCYYHLDICFGDLSLEDLLRKAGATTIRRYGDYNYNCFCVSTEEILKTRSIEDVETLPLCDSNLPTDEIKRLSCVDIKERDGVVGCQLTHIGSSADIFLCSKDKNVVLKKFRGNDTGWSPYSEDVERTATTAAPAIVDADGNGNFEEEFSLAELPDEIRDALSDDSMDVISILRSDDVENYCRTMGLDRPTTPTDNKHNSESEPNSINKKLAFDYTPRPEGMYKPEAAIGSVMGSVFSLIGIILGGISGWFCRKSNNTEEYDEVYSSIFAPSEVKPKTHMLVQVYLHLYEETEKVKALAQESDRNAERRDYIPLQCKLKKGDKVDVQLNIYGETLQMSDKKSVVWQGSFTKCSFDYFVPKDIDVDELSCVAMLTVNRVPVGEMRFITRIVDAPRQLNPEIIAHKYNKVFISYSHQDESKVKFLHEGLELGAVPHFFDRKYLKAGDVFPQVIQDYINSADLFILCWSENASKSEYVQKERLQALERAFPQVKPEQEAKLRIYPMSIEPRAELPTDMKENYHFGEM